MERRYGQFRNWQSQVRDVVLSDVQPPRVTRSMEVLCSSASPQKLPLYAAHPSTQKDAWDLVSKAIEQTVLNKHFG